MRLLFLLGLVGLLTACGDDGGPTPNPQENILSISTTLSAEQMVPAVDSTASGSASFSVNLDSGAITGSVTYQDIVPTIAHIHRAYAGANGGPVVTLASQGNNYVVPDGSVLDQDSLAALQAGELYINLHSASHPSGEIRGQLLPEEVQLLRTSISSVQTTNNTNSESSGIAFTTIHRTDLTLTTNVISDVQNPTAAHIHQAFAGLNGAPVITLQQDGGSANFSASQTITQAQMDALNNGEWYINIHSTQNASGEIRGQLLPKDLRLFVVDLDGDQVVPPVTTAASGRGFVTLDVDDASIRAYVNTADISIAAAHIHRGDVGVSGNVLEPLLINGNDAQLLELGPLTLSPTDLGLLQSEGLYINVHTATNPAGEIRGQIISIP